MIKVQMIQDDIANGLVGHTRFCAVARAIHRATGVPGVEVDPGTTGVKISFGDRSTELPRSVLEFVKEFDNLPKLKDERPDPESVGYHDLKPLDFELPDWEDTVSWQGCCSGCCDLVPVASLDENQRCPVCAREWEMGF